jgi:hypothetical protein
MGSYSRPPDIFEKNAAVGFVLWYCPAAAVAQCRCIQLIMRTKSLSPPS